MASYTVDILVALKGAQKLQAFNKRIKETDEISKTVNRNMKLLAKDNELVIRSFNSLGKAVSEAKKNFNDAAIGTSVQKKAAKELAQAQRELNRELAIGNGLLKAGTKISPVDKAIARNQRRRPKRDPRSGFRSFSERADELRFQGQSSLLPPRSPLPPRSSLDPGKSLFGQTVSGASDRSRQILAENQALQEALGSMNARAFGRFKFMPPIQGTTESQLALKTRVSSNVAESQRIREIVAAGSNRAGLGGGFKEFNKNAKKIQADTKKISTIVAQNQSQGIQAFGNQQFAQPIGPVRPGPLGRLGIGTGANPRGIFANSRGRAGRISGGLSNALIGGGFPLLFGQGALGAAGGGIGGAIGGALGGPFGFGLSIAGTAIAQRIKEGRDFQKQIDKVNNSILATGSSATFTARDIKKLGKTLGLTKEEALKAAQSFKAFDASMRTSLLLTFGDEATFNLIKGLKTNVQLINDIQEAETIIGREKADQLLTALRTEGSLKVQKRLQDEIIKVRENERIGNKNKVTNFDRFMGGGRTLGNRFLNLFGQGPGAGNAQVTGEDIRDIRIDKVLGENLENKIAGVNQLGVEFDRAMGIKLTSNIAAVRDELEALVDPINRLISLAETVGNAFGESFKGLITGSMSAQEALRNLFMRTADHFIDMAAQMIAKQIQMKILGIGLNFAGGLFSGGGSAGANNIRFGSQNLGINTASNFPGFADGGRPPLGRASIVGERGPELFVPDRAGTIIPNNAMGGAMNVIVNVDASGSSVEGDEQGGRELGRVISAAVQSELIQQKRPGGLLA